ncbi:MAG: chemotaxis protein [Gammaproteobacteria bacterium]|nr:chemotaxis protein [Gammaproteobacteria bacterium]
MMKDIELLLARKIGLLAESVGSETIARAVKRRMAACKQDDADLYLGIVQNSGKEWEALVEEVVVPETWFFRNHDSFVFLGHHVQSEWLPAHRNNILRVLSIPCSSGEEAYSIAMVLMDAGLAEGRFRVDAVDINHKVLYKAKRGVYTAESFRGNDKQPLLQTRYFEEVMDSDGNKTWLVDSSVRRAVRFMRGNLLDALFLAEEPPYDIVFCRNLLIYFGAEAKAQTLKMLERLLVNTGILFMGHAERPLVCGPGFAHIRRPGVFACRKTAGPLLEKGEGDVHSSLLSKKRREAVRSEKVHPKISPDSVLRFDDHKLSKGGKHPFPQKWNSLSKTEPEHPENKLETAKRLADQGALQEALALCEKYLRENTAHVQAHFLMGVVCHALGDEGRAETSFNKTLYLDPNHSDALNHLAFIAEYRGEARNAAQLRRRALRIRQREEKA